MSDEDEPSIPYLMATNEGIGGGRGSPYSDYDWEYAGDDLDSQDWETACGGLDDDEIEERNIAAAEAAYEQHVDSLLGSVDETRADGSASSRMPTESCVNNAARLEQIVEWLRSTELVTQCAGGQGFSVNKGAMARLADKSTVDLFDWLFEEGIADGDSVAGYQVGYFEPDSEQGERLTFTKLVVDAPFFPNRSAMGESLEDDIPW